MRGMLVEEQNGLALLDNDIGVQRLADDAEGLFRDRKRLLCFRLFAARVPAPAFQTGSIFGSGASRSSGSVTGFRLPALRALLRMGFQASGAAAFPAQAFRAEPAPGEASAADKYDGSSTKTETGFAAGRMT